MFTQDDYNDGMNHVVHAILIMLLLATPPLAAAEWTLQTINTMADFRGLAAVDAKVAWVSGTQGTVGRTIDGGTTWQVRNVKGAEKLDFRDVKAFSDRVAYALSIGPGDASRIYKTIDGGENWQLQFQNDDKNAFYDCMAFWSETHGLALSDPVDGKYRILRTDDGKTWSVVPGDGMPAALAKEGAFAASGSCLVARGKKDAWFVTGGGPSARFFRTNDSGTTWTARESAVAGGTESAGAFALAFKNDNFALLIGGDYKKPDTTGDTAAFSTDGGAEWIGLAGFLPFRSGAAWTKDAIIVVGSSGSNYSKNDGGTWKVIDRENWNVVRSAADGTTWAAGPKGRIGKLAW